VLIAQAAPVEAPPSGDTVSLKTPPTPMAPKPASRSKTVIAGVLTAGASMLGAAKEGLAQIKDAIGPFAADSVILQGLISHIALVSAGLAVATVAFAWLKTRNTQ
jgi:hypothetical protein